MLKVPKFIETEETLRITERAELLRTAAGRVFLGAFIILASCCLFDSANVVAKYVGISSILILIFVPFLLFMYAEYVEFKSINKYKMNLSCGDIVYEIKEKTNFPEHGSVILFSKNKSLGYPNLPDSIIVKFPNIGNREYFAPFAELEKAR